MNNKSTAQKKRLALNMKWRKTLPIVIGLTLLCIVLYQIDIDKATLALTQADPCLLIMGFLLQLASLCVKGCRHYVIALGQSTPISFTHALTIYFKSVFWGFVSPGRIGEFSRIIYLAPHTKSNLKSLANVLIDRMLDLFAVLLFLALSTIFIEIQISKHYLMLIGGGLVALTAAAFILWIAVRITGLDSIRRLLLEVCNTRNIPALVLITFLAWTTYYYAMYLFSVSIQINQHFFFIIFCAAASNIIALLPISIAGIGTRDALLLLIFSAMSIDTNKAVIFSTFFLSTYVLQVLFSYLFILTVETKE